MLAAAEAAVAAGAIPWTVLRPALIYGLGLDRNVTAAARFIRRWHCFPLGGPGKGLRQPVHADDLAAAALAALDLPAAEGQSFNLGGGETLSYRPDDPAHLRGAGPASALSSRAVSRPPAGRHRRRGGSHGAGSGLRRRRVLAACRHRPAALSRWRSRGSRHGLTWITAASETSAKDRSRQREEVGWGGSTRSIAGRSPSPRPSGARRRRPSIGASAGTRCSTIPARPSTAGSPAAVSTPATTASTAM